MKVLVVDDSQESRVILSEILLHGGFDVIKAENGLEAIKLVEKETPDIIISDIMMPVMDGFMLIKNLNEKSTIKKIPFIFYTCNYVSKDDMDFGLSLGASKFVLKPKSPTEILNIINSVIKEFEAGKPEHDKPEFFGEKYLEKYNERLFLKLESKIKELEQEINMRKEAQEALQQSEDKYRTLIDNIQDGVFIIQDAKFQFLNEAFSKISGYSEEQLIGRDFRDLIVPKDNELVIEKYFRRQKQENIKKEYEFRLLHSSGERKTVNMTVGHITYRGKVASMGTVKDITQNKLAEEALKESEERNRRLVEAAPFGITIHSARKLVYLNSEAQKILGASSTEQIIGKSIFELIHPDYYNIANNRIRLQEEGKNAPLTEVKFLRIDGTPVDVEIMSIPFMYKGKRSLYEVFLDITKRKQSDERISRSLKEKEILLREVHHRVMNNMQIISGLLELQSDYIEEKKYKEIFKESQNRILTMSLVHEKLYQSSYFARIDIDDYVQDMVNLMFQSYGVSADKIKLNMNIEDVSLGVDLAIPCGLIINELVTNSIKHAFPDDRKGEIGIIIRKMDNNGIELVIMDNGVGIPEGVDLKQSSSMGLYLARILAEDQLDGEMILSRSNGTEFRIKFKGGK